MRRAELTVIFQMCRGRPGHRDISVDDSLLDLIIGFYRECINYLVCTIGVDAAGQLFFPTGG